MELSSFGRIGKAVLTKAIGLQNNYKEIIKQKPDKLNEVRSGCCFCPIYEAKKLLKAVGLTEEYNIIDEKCRKCSNAVFEKDYEVRYVNEKDYYGYQPTLKSNCLKLFLVYHFLCPDSRGVIKNINIKDLAALIGCTVSTIKNANKTLSEYGYCCFCDSGEKNCINIWLMDYKNYHKKAKEGGRGYLTLSSDLISKLIQIKELNTLRLNLRGLLEIDTMSLSTSTTNASENQISSATTITTSYQNLQRFLPDYCKRNIIQKSLKKNSTIFDFVFQNNCITFNLKNTYSAKSIRNQMKETYKTNIVEYIGYLNNIFSQYNNAKILEEDSQTEESISTIISQLSIAPTWYYNPIDITSDDYYSLASMSIQYGLEIVKQAIIIVYNNYIIPDKKIENYGALIRTTIRRISYLRVS